MRAGIGAENLDQWTSAWCLGGHADMEHCPHTPVLVTHVSRRWRWPRRQESERLGVRKPGVWLCCGWYCDPGLPCLWKWKQSSVPSQAVGRVSGLGCGEAPASQHPPLQVPPGRMETRLSPGATHQVSPLPEPNVLTRPRRACASSVLPPAHACPPPHLCHTCDSRIPELPFPQAPGECAYL